MARHRTTPVPERTIAPTLHTAWLANKKKGDAQILMDKLQEHNEKNLQDNPEAKKIPGSKPTIEKAILYGHCLDDNLRDFISKYFEERNAVENIQGSIL